MNNEAIKILEKIKPINRGEAFVAICRQGVEMTGKSFKRGY